MAPRKRAAKKVAKKTAPPRVTPPVKYREVKELAAKHRREKFAHLIAAGKKLGAAAKEVGYAARSANSRATELLKQDDVVSIIENDTRSLAERCGIDAERVMREYAALGFSNILDYLDVDSHNGVVIDLTKMTRQQAAAIQEITVEEYMDRIEGTDDEFERVKRTKFKLHSKEVALDKMAKHLGIKGFGTKTHVIKGDRDNPIQHQHLHAHAVKGLSIEDLEAIAMGKEPERLESGE